MADELLRQLKNDFRSTLIAVRWINFLQDRVSPDEIPKLFEYYAKIGWISMEAQKKLTDMADGLKPASEYYEQAPIEPFVPAGHEFSFKERLDRIMGEDQPPSQEFDRDWRLASEDHLRSYMFIKELVGETVNKDEWNSIELRIGQFRQGLKAYYGV